MSICPKTYSPAQSIGIVASGDIPAFRFVNHLGALCANNGKAAGVTEASWNNLDMMQVMNLGLLAVELSTTINCGGAIGSDANGKAKPWVSGPVNGYALETETTGYIRFTFSP